MGLVTTSNCVVPQEEAGSEAVSEAVTCSGALQAGQSWRLPASLCVPFPRPSLRHELVRTLGIHCAVKMLKPLDALKLQTSLSMCSCVQGGGTVPNLLPWVSGGTDTSIQTCRPPPLLTLPVQLFPKG